jgi:glycolate oxidase FAD binding subunit
MMMDAQQSDSGLKTFVDQIALARENQQTLTIQGGGTKQFYGEQPNTAPIHCLDTRAYSGIVDYEPSELVVTARCGTLLSDLQAQLAQNNQMLGFEPPHFGQGATLGGCIAAGLSGPRRASSGSARDFVLGADLLDSSGQLLHFGGKVMKNVAGYDVSRLLVGSMGILGVITQVSLKVLPMPLASETRVVSLDHAQALVLMNQWATKPLPISATVWRDQQLVVRLEGSEPALAAARKVIGGDAMADAPAFWHSLKEQTLPFFKTAQALWRLSLPSMTPAIDIPGEQWIEWGGSQRWLSSDAPSAGIRELVQGLGGSATVFRGVIEGERFHPMSTGVLALNRSLKQQFDPHAMFNPQRLTKVF